MRHGSVKRSCVESLRAVLVSLLLVLIAFGLIPTAPRALAQGGALDSTITLQMPFIAGEAWTVGGDGSFYGNGAHCNDPNNDYYATDWNRTNDNGAADTCGAVLPLADGAR